MAKQHHVVPNDNGWGIKTNGGAKSIQNFPTQKEAINRAREISQNQGSELFIHGKDGQIRSRDSHGNDPYPPKG
jgi:hypothetical protein